jgi:hypothetical protein
LTKNMTPGTGLMAANTPGSSAMCRIPVSASAAKPDQHDGAEEGGDAPRSAALDRKERNQDAERDRNHVGLERRRGEFQPFHGRQHRNGRGDHRVAVKQRRPGDAERDRNAPPAPALKRALGQRHEGQRPPFALVVRPQQDEDIFQRHDEHERPQDQRQHADDNVARHVGPAAGRGGHRLAKGVKRARADVAVHDAERAEGER